MNGIIGIVKLGSLFVSVVVLCWLVGSKLWIKLIIVCVLRLRLCINKVIVIIVISDVGIVLVSFGNK